MWAASPRNGRGDRKGLNSGRPVGRRSSWAYVGDSQPSWPIAVTVPINIPGTGFYRVRGVPSVPPFVTTDVATGLSGTAATLNGSANPNGNSTTGWFRYSTISPGVGNDSFGTRAPASGGSALGSGFGSVSFAQSLTGLTPGTTYYHCAIASNAEGISFGPIQTFTTP